MIAHSQSSHQITGNANGGFTLIEVLMAIAIFAIGFMAVWQMQIRAVNSNALGRDVTEASTLGASQAEDLLRFDFTAAELVEGTYTDTTQPPYNVAWTISEDSNITGLKQINVTVDWGSRSIPINTYVVDHP